jgi:hypothetical protein
MCMYSLRAVQNLLDNADALGFVNSTGYSPYPYNSTGLNTQVLPAYPVSDYFWKFVLSLVPCFCTSSR